MFFRLGQKALVRDGPKFLMLRQSGYNKFGAGKWDLPGGKVEENEDLGIAIKRELREETGLNADCKLCSNFTFATETGENWLVLIYVVRYDGSPVALSSEHSEFKWIGMEELDKLPLKHEGIAAAIRKALGPVV
ncbi:MAG: NUDIX domain-containing protein [Candidatus Aenigmarchaeota archaeon]|nr:NUDIX domain-containing protein [Candidatus Aenigmarchaeota archaeon]